MARRSTFRTMLRRAMAPAALLIVGAFFGGYAIMGPNGALGLWRHQAAAGQAPG